MFKKILILVSCLLILTFCALWSPWKSLNISLGSIFGIEPQTDFAQLYLSSLGGELEVSVDGEKKGSVGPEGSPFLIEDIEPGRRVVKLARVPNGNAEYISIEKVLDFSSDVDTVIAYEIGPSLNFSEGHIITARKNFLSPNATTLNVVTQPNEVEVLLNGNSLGQSPVNNVSLNLGGENRLLLRKPGYEEMQITLLTEDAAEREKLVGYEIFVEANLFLLPIRVEVN